MKKNVLICLLLAGAVTATAQSIRVAQVDTSRLLVRGTVDAYVALSESGAGIMSPEAWDAWEMTGDDDDGVTDRQLEVVEVVPGAAADTGIDFLLLVDNSGSMYDLAPDGRTRMEHVQDALRAFLGSVDGSQDRVALASFNTYVSPLAPLGASTGELVRSLERIEQPDTESAYTELYQAMQQQLAAFPSSGGRKAVIVLSDGEDYPFNLHSGVTHPVWGDQRLRPDEVTQAFRDGEATLYGISFADAPDRALAEIANSSGGTVFEAYDAQDLSGVYDSIRQSIRGEVRLRLRVPAATESARNVTVSYRGQSDDASYFAPLLLGAPADLTLLLPLFLGLLAVSGIAGLHFISLEKAAKAAEIQPIGRGSTVLLRSDVTVIGSATDAEVSIAGNRGVELRHATVVHDAAAGIYTLVSERPVRVNNTLVKNRKLAPGDVIAIEDVTLVFDAPADAEGS